MNRRQTPLWLQMRNRGYGPDDILDYFDQQEPPVDIAGILRGMGVDARVLVRGSTLDGFLDPTADPPVIAVNPDHHVHRQRFTAAHELGHLMLHRLEVQYRDVATSRGNRREEAEANSFAAELLMPQRMIVPLSTKHRYDELRRMFKVSPAALDYRLSSLLRYA